MLECAHSHVKTSADVKKIMALLCNSPPMIVDLFNHTVKLYDLASTPVFITALSKFTTNDFMSTH